MQNEIIEMHYCRIMTKIIKTINECGDFGTMADEGSDASNTELLSTAVRQCNDKLECDEHWSGCQSLENVKRETVTNGLKVLCILNFIRIRMFNAYFT